jgi:hypothetical protein
MDSPVTIFSLNRPIVGIRKSRRIKGVGNVTHVVSNVVSVLDSLSTTP